MHSNTSFAYGHGNKCRPAKKHRRPNNLTQTHKAFRNEYGILPVSFLDPQKSEILASILGDYTHAVFTCHQTELPHLSDALSNNAIHVVTHFLASECCFTRDEERPDENIILNLLEAEKNNFCPPLAKHDDNAQSALRHGGNVLRTRIDALTTILGVHRYPQRIIVCGSHLLGTIWIRSVIRSQQKACVAGRAREFDPLIMTIEEHAPANGKLGISTTAHVGTKTGIRFIVSDTEMPGLM